MSPSDRRPASLLRPWSAEFPGSSLTRYSVGFCVGLLLLAWPALALAEEPLELPPVVVEALSRPAQEQVPSFVTVLEAEELEASGGAVVDLLERVTGVFIRSSGGDLQQSEISLRGAAGEQVLVLFNGARLNSLAGGAFDLSLLPLAAIDKVVVLRGSGALDYGSGAEGGVVSFESAPPADADLMLHSSLGVGSWESLRAELQVGAALDLVRERDLELGLGLSLDHSKGDFSYEDAQGSAATRQNNDAQRGALFGSARWLIDEAELQFAQLASWLERGVAGPSEFPARFAKARQEAWEAVSNLAAAKPLWISEDYALLGAARTSLRLAGDHYENPSTLLGASPYDNQSEEIGVEVELELELIKAWGESKLKLATRREGLDSRGSQGQVAASRWIYSGLLFERLHLLREALQLEAGVRLEGSDAGALEWVPRLGFMVQTSPWSKLRFNLGRAYRLPSFDELYLASEFVRGDPDLKSEQAVQADLGLELQPLPYLLFELGLFHTEYERVILFAPASALYYQAVNIEGAITQGAEITGLVQFERPWVWLDSLALRLIYSYTQAHFIEPPQDPLPGKPEHVAGGVVSAQIADLSFELDARWVGARGLDLFGQQQAEGQLWLDTSFNYAFWEGWNAALRLENLLNHRDAIDSLQLPRPGLGCFFNLSYGLEL